MANEKITVVARIKAKGGMEEAVRQELMSLISPSRADDGCINYDLHQATDDKSIFLFYENWSNKNNLDKHSKTPHFKSFFEKAESMLAEPIDITLWEMIS